MASRFWLAQYNHLIRILFLCSLGGAKTIEQPTSATALERNPYHLRCNLSSVTSEMIQWYQQVSGQTPRYLGGGYPKYEDDIENPKGKLYFSEDKASSRLVIDEVSLADAAVYFCVLKDGLSTGNEKVYFGSGSRLIVMPNLKNSNPSVYQLKPKEKQSNLAACLITDYSPDPIDVNFNSNLEPVAVNGSAVVVKEDGNKESASLGVVIWSKNEDQFQCSATHGGNTYVAEKEGDATCSETPSDTPVFETDENLNLLSLTVLGLRLIFFKSVALNLILTFWAWSR